MYTEHDSIPMLYFPEGAEEAMRVKLTKDHNGSSKYVVSKTHLHLKHLIPLMEHST